jgi:hypothetical protein
VILDDGRTARLSFFPVQLHGKVADRPDVHIPPYNMNLKISSKLVFLSRECVDRIVMQNLTFDGKTKTFRVDANELLNMTRNADISYMKSRFYDTFSKLVIPEVMFNEEFTTEEYKEVADIKSQKRITIDVTIIMPRCELTLDQDGQEVTFVKNMNVQDMTLLIKDKFSSWNELTKEIISKKIRVRHYTESKSKPNRFIIHSSNFDVANIDWSTHCCEDFKKARDEAFHFLSIKLYFTPYDFVFL